MRHVVDESSSLLAGLRCRLVLRYFSASRCRGLSNKMRCCLRASRLDAQSASTASDTRAVTVKCAERSGLPDVTDHSARASVAPPMESLRAWKARALTLPHTNTGGRLARRIRAT